ncbi:MAG: putative MFS-type transporter YhjX [Firmicutes bacterium]|nr:putative MFS-type transporter YhjX [Bacillota bacterium]
MKSNNFRYLVAVAGFLTTLCLGTLYAWSIFMPALQAEFGWSRATVTIPFTVAGLVFAFGMLPAGRFQDLKGPRPLIIFSAVALIIGYGLSAMAQNLIWLVISYGIITGAALGAGYSAVVAGGLKWFPDMKGTATGILVGGFGASAAVFGPIAHYAIDAYGWRTAFWLLGGVFSAVVALCSFVLINPPKGWLPAGWNPSKGVGIRKPSPEYTGYEFPFKAMLATSQFWLMWLQFVLILCGGFSIIVHLRPLALELGFSEATATGLVAIISLSNLFGRFVLSPLSDIIGRLKSFTLVGTLMMAATIVAPVAAIYNIPGLLYFTATVGGVAFGGYLGLSPAFTADSWGMKNVGVNYGGMITAWGIASFIGPFFTGLIRDVTASYNPAFFVWAVLCIPAIVFTERLVKPAALKQRAVKLGLPKTETA